MAYDPITLSRPGQVNSSGDALALFLKVFSGEVLAAFSKTQQFMDRHMVKSISSGKSATFPVLGRATAGYHVPGTAIDGQAIPGNERVISIDGLLIAPVMVYDLDEAMNHFDARSEYVAQIAEIMAQKFDINVAANMILAARAPANVTGLPGGTVITNASMATDSNVLAAALFSSVQALDEKFVHGQDRTTFVRPAQFYALVQNTVLINKFYSGEGSIAKGEIASVAGPPIVKTVNLPSTDLTSDTTVSPSGRASFTKTVALVSHKSCAGTVKLMDIGMEHSREARFQADFMVGKFAMGHGVLRPEAAVELAIP